MLRLSGYLPSDSIETNIPEAVYPSDSRQATQKALFLWGQTRM